MVAIIILILLGPSIGKIFSNVSIALGGGATPQVTPTPVGAWIFCADEGDDCTFPGTKTIRYGESGYYVTQILTNSTPCDNDTFGDPIYGTYKHCHCWDPNANP